MHWRAGLPVLGGIGVFAVLLCSTPASAQGSANGAVYVQCPPSVDTNDDGVPDAAGPDSDGDGIPDIKCMHLAGGDGFVTMADGRPQYMFGFSDVTAVPPGQVMEVGALAANFPAPTITLNEGQHFYLSLTNVGMVMRPDLSDPHSVHFHGFPNAAPIFDGTPENSLSVNMGSSLSYYYKIMEPGTYMYHCHVEATEHMQMGMLGNLYVKPRQNTLPGGTALGSFTHTTGQQYAYNDGDGSTRYDVEKAIQIGSFDPDFHDASETVQPLPFATMRDRYGMLNGRGYPDTVNPVALSTDTDRGPKASQPVDSLVTATAGQRVLLRISNLNVTRFYTLASTIPMKVVGQSARLHRGPSGTDLTFTTNSVTVGGGESVDVILDTTGLSGTYLLYTTNLNYLSNDTQDFGGMMTEIRIQ
jgi:FtsP/CotA-like multicopper oxidase with cupredoxin domain